MSEQTPNVAPASQAALAASLAQVRGELAALKDHNARLILTLRDAREQMSP
jgi:hypothetical protein